METKSAVYTCPELAEFLEGLLSNDAPTPPERFVFIRKEPPAAHTVE